MDATARFALPQLSPGQMQKEFYHNEALLLTDLLLCPVVEGPASATPPASPSAGACYLVAGGATGAWAGHDGQLAGFTEAGWRFVTPLDGMGIVDRSTGLTMTLRNGAWETGILQAQELRINGQTVTRERQAAIADPSGGTTVDSQCRTAVASVLAALRAHGLIA